MGCISKETIQNTWYDTEKCIWNEYVSNNFETKFDLKNILENISKKEKDTNLPLCRKIHLSLGPEKYSLNTGNINEIPRHGDFAIGFVLISDHDQSHGELEIDILTRGGKEIGKTRFIKRANEPIAKCALVESKFMLNLLVSTFVDVKFRISKNTIKSQGSDDMYLSVLYAYLPNELRRLFVSVNMIIDIGNQENEKILFSPGILVKTTKECVAKEKIKDFFQNSIKQSGIVY